MSETKINTIKAQKIDTIQEQEYLNPEDALAKLLNAEVEKDEHHGLQLSKETVRRILELLSRRQDICDEDRDMLRLMIRDLTNELYDSKYAQAGVYLGFAIASGVLGLGGVLGPNTGWGEGLKAAGGLLSGGGQFSNLVYSAEQMKPETAKQFSFDGMHKADGAGDKMDQAIHRILDNIQNQMSTENRARGG